MPDVGCDTAARTQETESASDQAESEGDGADSTSSLLGKRPSTNSVGERGETKRRGKVLNFSSPSSSSLTLPMTTQARPTWRLVLSLLWFTTHLLQAG